MSTEDSAAGNTVATTATDEPTTNHQRVLDLDAAEPASVPGATVIFASTHVRTDDGHALRYDGDVPIAAVGIYSETDARDALAECYAAENIDRAFRVGEWMHGHTPAHATAAVSHAESAIATDGGSVETCAQCGRESVEANDERRDDDVSGSERADMGGGPTSGVDEL